MDGLVRLARGIRCRAGSACRTPVSAYRSLELLGSKVDVIRNAAVRNFDQGVAYPSNENQNTPENMKPAAAKRPASTARPHAPGR